ncbi:MAG: type II toxin-antitoxin system VapC family toxin [Gammaproteobacteria bacterium]|nr:type II toxin-antitoxin system VapC family toxin [Gammaproteobacteria bacterium]
MGVIYLDACLLIYLVEAHPDFGPRVRAAMEQIVDANFAISPLVKMECLVAPLKRGDPVLQRNYESLFLRFRSLSVPETVFLQAASLRARFGLKSPDALHLACAQHHGCDALWTHDSRLASASHGLARDLSVDLT